GSPLDEDSNDTEMNDDPGMYDDLIEKNVLTVAIIGTDSRSGSGGTLNSDVLMVAVIDLEENDAYLLSIPRDTKIKIPGQNGYHKANAAYSIGEMIYRQQKKNNQELTMNGNKMVQEMLSQFLDIPINYYVNVDFNGFIDVVNAVDGVKIDVKKSMLYDDPTDGTHINIS